MAKLDSLADGDNFTPRQKFKVAFIAMAIDNGAKTTAEVINMAKQAMEKTASLKSLLPLSMLTGTAKPLALMALAAPPAVGGALGYLAGSAPNLDSPDKDDIQTEDLLAEYKQQLEHLRRIKKLKK